MHEEPEWLKKARRLKLNDGDPQKRMKLERELEAEGRPGETVYEALQRKHPDLARAIPVVDVVDGTIEALAEPTYEQIELNPEHRDAVKGALAKYNTRLLAQVARHKGKGLTLDQARSEIWTGSQTPYRIAIAQELLATGHVEIGALSDKLRGVAKRNYTPHQMREAMRVMEDYARTGGRNCVQRGGSQ